MAERILTVVVRDLNGRWLCNDFHIGEVPDLDPEEYEIMLVSIGGMNLYNALRDEPITSDDLRGFWS